MIYLRQYKNLIFLVLGILFLLILFFSDPLGFYAQRAHDRAVIYNKMKIEEAQTAKYIAIIKAEADAELERIRLGLKESADVKESEGVGEDVN